MSAASADVVALEPRDAYRQRVYLEPLGLYVQADSGTLEALSLQCEHEQKQDSKFQERIGQVQQQLRFEPLGQDRHRCRYWQVEDDSEFLRGCLLVERPKGAPAVAEQDPELTESEPLGQQPAPENKSAASQPAEAESWRSFGKQEQVQ